MPSLRLSTSYTVTPTHHIFLIDGSGSMDPAWSEAWSQLFQQLKATDASFSLLLFKTPRALTPAEAEAVIATDNQYYAIVDVAKVLRQRNLVRIKKTPSPDELGIRFRGWTPLIAAIITTTRLARKNYPSANLTITIISDNRDSLYARDPLYRQYYNDAEVIQTKIQEKVIIQLLPVGTWQRRYIEKYDKILTNNNIKNIIRLI